MGSTAAPSGLKAQMQGTSGPLYHAKDHSLPKYPLSPDRKPKLQLRKGWGRAWEVQYAWQNMHKMWAFKEFSTVDGMKDRGRQVHFE